MKLIIVGILSLTLPLLASAREKNASAESLKCTWEDGKNENRRMDQEYEIVVDEEGTLLSVDGSPAKAIGENKYKSDGKTFWYYSDNQRLRRYDASIGNTYYECK